MAHRSLRLLALLLLSGCATAGSLPQPGAHRLASADDLGRTGECRLQPKPRLRFESGEVLPVLVRAGQPFGHRFVYVLCPDAGARTVRGRLVTRIYRGDTLVARDVSEGYRLRPGRWRVDARIEPPTGISAGLYTIVVSFEGGGVAFEDSTRVAVLP